MSVVGQLVRVVNFGDDTVLRVAWCKPWAACEAADEKNAFNAGEKATFAARIQRTQVLLRFAGSAFQIIEEVKLRFVILREVSGSSSRTRLW